MAQEEGVEGAITVPISPHSVPPLSVHAVVLQWVQHDCEMTCFLSTVLSLVNKQQVRQYDIVHSAKWSTISPN